MTALEQALTVLRAVLAYDHGNIKLPPALFREVIQTIGRLEAEIAKETA